MENMQNAQGTKQMCKCPHHKVISVLIMLFGLVFLLGMWGILSWNAVNVIWPVLVIIGGAMKFSEKVGMCKCCSNTYHCC